MVEKTRVTRRPRKKDTKLAFLKAAEEVFCEIGYNGTTIRAIATRANANLGTLQYYWGGKQELFSDLFKMRFAAMNEIHLAELKAIEAATGEDEIPSVEQIIRALVTINFSSGELCTDEETPDVLSDDGVSSRRLYGCALMDPSPVVIQEINTIFKESVELFVRLMKRACPDTSAAELDWRINCIVGSHVFSLIYQDRVGVFMGEGGNVDPQTAGEWVVAFLMNGINGKPVAPAEL